MGLTPSQQNAVDVRDRTLLVSAAAGSGKTYTLTQRIIKAIIEDGQDLSRLLIVTFTRAAAGELKAKISKALGEAIAAHPADIHLQRQLIKLGSAHISTIDAFFSEPVRANFEKLSLPASIRLCDEAELAPIRDEILSETLDSFFAECPPYSNFELSPVGYNNRYTDLISIISGARDSSSILPTFFDIYKKLMTSPNGLEQLNTHAKRLCKNASIDFFQTLEGKAMKDELYSTVSHARKTLQKALDDMQIDSFVASKYSADFAESISLTHSILNALEAGEYDDVVSAFDDFKPKAITRISKDQQTETSEYYKALRSKLNTSIKEVRKNNLYLQKERLSELFLVYSDMCSLLYKILTAFDKKYSEEKRRRGICEFSDMPRFMLRLLIDDSGEPTEYAKALRDSFDEVYIDEYQDVNEIQDSIFSLIGGKHRFMVGDIKQSIYGFREAEPSIFAQYRKSFPIYDNSNSDLPQSEGSTIFMSENFRCDENVIHFTNAVCSRVFSAFSESIGYTSDDDLKFGKIRKDEDHVSPKVCINILQRPEEADKEYEDDECEAESLQDSESASGLGDEAIVTANSIAELIAADERIEQKHSIAVLVRSLAHARPLIKALGTLNIKYALSSKGELFKNDDMRLLVTLLSVVNNPREDVPLCHLLTAESKAYSPELTLEEVIRIRRASDSSRSLYDAMIQLSISENDIELKEKCKDFISRIDRMRKASCGMSADKFVKSLMSLEKYSALTKTEAFTYLYDAACRYVKNTWGSLYSFIAYFKDLVEKGESGSEPDPNIDGAVRIMTIHQSKGLEFDYCFLFGFGKNFNMQNKYSIIFNKEFGPSMKLPQKPHGDVIENIKSRHEDNPIYKTLDRYNKQKQREEEARIFYVALTRAKERLIISATLGKAYDKLIRKYEHCVDPIYDARKSMNYITWIMSAIASGSVGDDICSVNIFDRGNVSLTHRSSKHVEEGDQVLAPSEHETLLASFVNAKKQTDDDLAMLSSIPSKVAASKVSSHMLDDTVFIPIPFGKQAYDGEIDADGLACENAAQIKARIELMRSSAKDFEGLLEVNKKPTAAEIGTATHEFLQFCSYHNVSNSGIEHEILRLKEESFISARTADIIDRHILSGFFSSKLFEYISSAVRIRREFKFGMFRSATDFTEDEALKAKLTNKKIYVQGSIDLLLEMPDGSIVLCDYKTDRMTREERNDTSLFISRIREKHSEQLIQYQYAIKKIFGKTPSKTFIYSFALNDTIDVIL